MRMQRDDRNRTHSIPSGSREAEGTGNIRSKTVRAKKIAFVNSRWHGDIVGVCRASFEREMKHLKADQYSIIHHEVPGAFEIPLIAKVFAETGLFSAVAVAGFVVDGGIYRHEFVAHAVIDGLMRVQLDSGVPVLSAVLTPQRFHEHSEHRRFFLSHMKIKGAELAVACVEAVESIATARATATGR